MFPALIVLFHTVGVFPSPIVIFSFLLCGLPSFDSNLLSELCRFIPFRFFAFCFFAFCLFVFSLLLSCAYQKLLVCRSAASWLTKPKTRSWPQFFRSGFRRPWRQGCPGCVRGRSCHLRLCGALSGGQLVFGKRHLFGLRCSILGGGPPIKRVHVFDFPFEEDNRSLEVAFETYGAVKSVKKQASLSNQIIFNGTRLVDVVLSGVLPRFLMVDGYLFIYLFIYLHVIMSNFKPDVQLKEYRI